MLNGVLASNLVAFHTHDYARHFRSACTKVLGKVVVAEGVQLDLDSDNFVSVAACPIGIDPTRFITALKTPAVQKIVDRYKKMFAGKQVLLGVDRLDYTKGIPNKLHALERFLSENPSYVGKIVFIQIAVPTRSNVEEYQILSADVHQIVSRINAKFGSVTGVPIHFLDKSVGFEELVALYHTADVCLCTSVRDGMNLVAFEFTICQDEDNAGVLILSEFAGAAQSLGAGAIRINPWDVPEIANALLYALTMRQEDRRIFHAFIRTHIVKHSSAYFVSSFLNLLINTKDIKLTDFPPKVDLKVLQDAFVTGRGSYGDNDGQRLVVLGMVGTLTTQSFPNRIETQVLSKESERKAFSYIDQLSADPNTTVLVITSRSRVMCDQVVGGSTAWIAAENGFFMRRNSKWAAYYDNATMNWLPEVRSVLQYFTDRTPRSFIFQAETHISWYYGECEKVFAAKQAQDLLIHFLSGSLANIPVQVVNTGRRIQIRPIAVSKSITLSKVIMDIEHEHGVGALQYVACMGSFIQMDQDLFSTLHTMSDDTTRNGALIVHTCNVGKAPSKGMFSVESSVAVCDILGELASTLQDENVVPDDGGQGEEPSTAFFF